MDEASDLSSDLPALVHMLVRSISLVLSDQEVLRLAKALRQVRVSHQLKILTFYAEVFFDILYECVDP